MKVRVYFEMTTYYQADVELSEVTRAAGPDSYLLPTRKDLEDAPYIMLNILAADELGNFLESVADEYGSTSYTVTGIRKLKEEK